MEIKVDENNVDGALKVLKRKLQKEGEIKRRKYYEKPSEKKNGNEERQGRKG